MKNPKKPTLKQAEILRKNRMDPDNWFVSKVLPDKFICVNRIDGKTKDAFLKVATI